MRILIFSTAYLPFIGGAEIALMKITDHIGLSCDKLTKDNDENIQFDLITARMDESLPKEDIASKGVRVYRVGFGKKIDKFFLPFLGLYKAIQLNQKNNYQIIWSIMASQAGIAAAFFKMLHPKKRFVLTLQEGDEEEYLARYVLGNRRLYKILIRPWHRMVIRKADYITAISNYLKARAIKAGAKSKIEVIPNGAAIVQTYYLSKTKTVILGELEPDERKDFIKSRRKELGVNESETVILTVSRLVKKNGVADLIRAVGLLKKDNPEIKFKLLVVGTGELEKPLNELAASLGLAKEIIFIGRVPNEEIANYYLLSDIFVRPSLSEGLGNVFLEALAAGLPIIGTPVGGIVDFLVDNETGLFCRPGDAEDIKDKILILLKDEVLRKKLAGNGVKIVKEKYSWPLIAGRMKEIFKELSKSRS